MVTFTLPFRGEVVVTAESREAAHEQIQAWAELAREGRLAPELRENSNVEMVFFLPKAVRISVEEDGQRERLMVSLDD
jgi:hypothetical protein